MLLASGMTWLYTLRDKPYPVFHHVYQFHLIYIFCLSYVSTILNPSLSLQWVLHTGCDHGTFNTGILSLIPCLFQSSSVSSLSSIISLVYQHFITSSCVCILCWIFQLLLLLYIGLLSWYTICIWHDIVAPAPSVIAQQSRGRKRGSRLNCCHWNSSNGLFGSSLNCDVLDNTRWICFPMNSYKISLQTNFIETNTPAIIFWA